MKKNDFILIAVIIIIAGAILFTHRDTNKTGTNSVKISVAGKVFGTYFLDEDQEIPINDTNLLVIRDGCVFMKKAECPDHSCVKQGKISKNKESIVCLPNKVIVEVISNQDSELDAIAK